MLALAIVVPFLNLNAADTPPGSKEARVGSGAMLVAFRPEGSAELKAQLLNTKWTWIHPGAEITFRENGQAWVNTDKEVKNWFVADAAGRVVAGTFAGSRTFMFTFSADLKTARAILDGDRVWEARRMK
ncbi:hypothetical protein CfE428DRAFT_6136 [Chthoniobacter flavus Ellin428]|uniref:Uncharacterized protein n=2 Tax=Chthoniobacter flavus TaxID=191863 RepID=B4DB45_9BACT|nr:hypothetical protein CfE428DRAFT_6136 [Chthoniobacter flavus Ellin428]TCO90260.1 hypothetical protein EV701_111186 [Chthoniobacter flavus]